jgi:hypothetical protein
MASTNAPRVYTDKDNARSGVVHLNGLPLNGLHIAGKWIDGNGRTFRITLGPDFNGARHFVTRDSEDNIKSRGVMRLTGLTPKVGKEHETPLYRGNLGDLPIVFYPLNDRLQIRLDTRTPPPPPSAAVLDFVNSAPVGDQHLRAVEATAVKQPEPVDLEDIPF